MTSQAGLLAYRIQHGPSRMVFHPSSGCPLGDYHAAFRLTVTGSLRILTGFPFKLTVTSALKMGEGYHRDGVVYSRIQKFIRLSHR